jgi:peptidoglycan hydrolase CwlO-like protein
MNDNLILIISNALTGIATYFVGRRQRQASTDNQVLMNLELAVGLYKNIIDDLKTEIHELNIKIQDLEKKVDDLMAENKKLKTEYTTSIKTDNIRGLKPQKKTNGTKLD